ncbi:MAG: ester cyclase [Actinomycetota bacterium]
MDKLRAVRATFEQGWNRQSFEEVESILAEPFLFHIGGSTRTMALDELREIVRQWHIGFPDLHFDLHAVVASGEHAAAHATLRGTHRGVWGDLEPTGRSIDAEHMFFFRFEGSWIVEVWELLDRSELRRQLVDDPGPA